MANWVKANSIPIACGVLLSFAGLIASAQDIGCERLRPDVIYNDFNDPALAVHLNTVETNHFIPDVENLRRGQTAPLPRDIAFVLRAFPNHYRALQAMARWQASNKLQLDYENPVWTADCYFERAIAFQPSDPLLHLIYGLALHRTKRLDEAVVQYDLAEKLGASSAEYYYNRGLLELDAGRITNAKAYADRAYKMGYPLPGLRNRLARATAQPAAPAKTRTENKSPSPTGATTSPK